MVEVERLSTKFVKDDALTRVLREQILENIENDEYFTRVLREAILKNVENDGKVVGIIPNIWIISDSYKVFVTTKKLIFGWKGLFDYNTSELDKIGPLYEKIGINELSYANITKVEIKKDWVHYWYHLTIWGLTKKMKEKKLIIGTLHPPFLYNVNKELHILSEKEAARKYAIETMKLLSSVLKDKIVKGTDLQNNAFSMQPSIYFSYPELEDPNKDKKLNKIMKRITKRREKNAKIKRVKQVAFGILVTMVGLIGVVGGYWLSNIGTIWGSIAGVILFILGAFFVLFGVMGPITGLGYVSII